METHTLLAEVGRDGALTVHVPSRLPPGPVEVVVTVRPSPAPARPDWQRLYGLGREVWRGLDADEYVRDLRADREYPDVSPR